MSQERSDTLAPFAGADGGVAEAEPGPVFIAGLADTGKTPLAQLLSDRTTILIVRRTRLWYRFPPARGVVGPRTDLDHLLRTLLHDPGVARLGPDGDRLRAALHGTQVTATDTFRLLHAHHAERLGKRRWGEQCNRLPNYAARLLRELPDARVIHLVRDPRVSYRIAAQRGGARPGRLGAFTGRWVTDVELARRHHAAFPNRYLLVRYEDLICSTDDTMRRVCAFLDEPAGDEPFAFPATQARDATSVVHKYARDVEGSAGASTGDQHFLAVHAGEQLCRLGYAHELPATRSSSLRDLVRRPADRLALAIARRRS